MKQWKLPAAALLAFGGIGAAQAGTLAGKLITDQYIVVLKSSTLPGPAAVAPVAQNLIGKVGGAELLHVYGNALNGFAVRMTAIQAQALRSNPLVAYVEQDRFFDLVATQSNPPSWGLDRIDQHNLPLNQAYT